MIQSGQFWLVLFGSALLFWVIPLRLRMGFLALASLAYLGKLEPVKTAALLGWALAFYWLAPMAAPNRTAGATAGRGRRWVLWLLIIGIVAYLGAFKYILPHLKIAKRGASAGTLDLFGISYFTFKFIHYAIETARGKITDRSFFNFLSYIFFIPTFSAGPIERFDHFLANRKLEWNIDHLVFGLTRIVHGLIKKFIIADMVFGPKFQIASSGLLIRTMAGKSAFDVWLIAIASYLYIYMEFAGYTDIAIGGGRLFGFGIMENFDNPVLSPNMSTFWRRWHMTLAGWCQSYIYMPMLGLTRRPNIATLVTFLAIGLWHGATVPWIAWGLYHAAGVMVHQAWVRYRKRRKWKWPDMVWWKVFATGWTICYVALGSIVTFGGLTSPYQVLRLVAKLYFITLHR